MMRVIPLFLLFLPFSVLAQSSVDSVKSPFPTVDSLYREDQFYVGLTYNRLLKTPEGYSQNGLATGFHAGFLRDMPLNKARTVAVAAGLGLSWNKYHHDMFVSESGGNVTYQILDDIDYDRNKLEQLFIEAPFEFRWRNSTPTSTKFWRIYAGFKVRWLVFNKSTFSGDDKIVVRQNDDLERLQYGPTLSVGYNTWNFHVYYGMNSLFRDGFLDDGQALDMRALNLGLMFYIL